MTAPKLRNPKSAVRHMPQVAEAKREDEMPESKPMPERAVPPRFCRTVPNFCANILVCTVSVSAPKKDRKNKSA